MNFTHYLAAVIDRSKNEVNIPIVNADQSAVDNIFGAVLMIAGAVAVIFIVLGGIKYSTSQGDSSATAQAKEMIIYSLVGLVVVIMAFMIVQLVVGGVFKV